MGRDCRWGSRQGAGIYAGETKNSRLSTTSPFEIDLPATHDLVSDRPGRVFESHGFASHGKAPRSDPHRELKRGLAHKIADALQTSLADRRYDKLILVAPPTTLGDLREALAKNVRACVTAELAKDLVKIPAGQLHDHLVDVLPLAAPRG